MRRNTATAEGVHPFSVLSPEEDGVGWSCPKEKGEDSWSARACRGGDKVDSTVIVKLAGHLTVTAPVLYLVFSNLQLSFSAFCCLLFTLPLLRFLSKTTKKEKTFSQFSPIKLLSYFFSSFVPSIWAIYTLVFTALAPRPSSPAAIWLLCISLLKFCFLRMSWWWTGRPGVLRFMGSQRVRHDWATELKNWRILMTSKLSSPMSPLISKMTGGKGIKKNY